MVAPCGDATAIAIEDRSFHGLFKIAGRDWPGALENRQDGSRLVGPVDEDWCTHETPIR